MACLLLICSLAITYYTIFKLKHNLRPLIDRCVRSSVVIEVKLLLITDRLRLLTRPWSNIMLSLGTRIIGSDVHCAPVKFTTNLLASCQSKREWWSSSFSLGQSDVNRCNMRDYIRSMTIDTASICPVIFAGMLSKITVRICLCSWSVYPVWRLICFIFGPSKTVVNLTLPVVNTVNFNVSDPTYQCSGYYSAYQL